MQSVINGSIFKDDNTLNKGYIANRVSTLWVELPSKDAPQSHSLSSWISIDMLLIFCILEIRIFSSSDGTSFSDFLIGLDAIARILIAPLISCPKSLLSKVVIDLVKSIICLPDNFHFPFFVKKLSLVPGRFAMA